MNNSMTMITPADIQPKKTRGESCDQRVRNAWKLQMPEADKAKFEKFPGYVKCQLFRTFDFEVQAIWVRLMKQARETALANGAKYIKVDGIDRLEDAHCSNVDELLITAASIWLEDFATRSAKGE